MSRMKRLNAKRTGDHSTVQKGMRHPLNRLLALPEVRKVAFGVTRACPRSQPVGVVLAHGAINGGIRLRFYHDRGFTEVFCYTEHPAVVVEAMNANRAG